MAPYEAFYGRRCRSPIGWFEAGETNLWGPDLVQEAMDKVQLIRQRLLTAQSRQKSYADKRRKGLVFIIGEKVFLRVSPMKGVVRFSCLNAKEIYISDSSQVLGAPVTSLDEKLYYEEEAMAIVDRQILFQQLQAFLASAFAKGRVFVSFAFVRVKDAFTKACEGIASRSRVSIRDCEGGLGLRGPMSVIHRVRIGADAFAKVKPEEASRSRLACRVHVR
ncbi:PREDICTED: uncharacterized protein LOC109238622 [Nicotiana attenuata]|uniref:uncharacterized protein LOC109238622 n=1 Tax=Nicotiana attenuata TaxID=49451 RepID=UPI000905BAF1|nr:PREDICTED: uncharacterized protein LOC109238622 [Nicotiana attenuata]